PGPGSDLMRTMMQRPRSNQPADVVEHSLQLFQKIGSPAFPQDPDSFREHLLAGVQRSYYPVGVMRQMLAVISDTTRYQLLSRIVCPTLVVHGSADPLVPIE